MKLRLLTLAGLFFLSSWGLGQSAGGYYSNDRWGFKVRAPKGWKSVALQSNEQWIASKHLGRQKLEAKKSEFYEAGYPEMWVIGFPHGVISEEDSKTTITIKNPYKDYKDLLKQNPRFLGGGYHFTKEEETEIKGVKVTQYEIVAPIVVDKMASAPYRVVAWVYHFKDADFAIEFKILQGYYRKHKVAFTGCLKSFTRIKRKGALPGGGVTTGDTIISIEDEKELTPDERAKRRQGEFEKTLRGEVDALPDDWFVQRSKRYVCIANCRKKFAKEVLNHAEAIRGYLDKTFGRIGSDYVPPGIIRAFATTAERNAYASGTSWSGVQQVIVSEESKKSGRKSWAMEPVSSGVTSQWMWFKNRNLTSNMPWWFRLGLEQHMRFARVKGKSVKIKPDDWDREQIKSIIKQGKAIPVRKLFEAGDDQQSYLMQCGSVISYMLTAGNKGKIKDIVPRYMKNMIKAINDVQKEFKKKRDANATKNAFDATFGALSDKDWKKLNKAWLKYAG